MVKEENKTKDKPAASKEPTIKERISQIVKNTDDKEELKDAIFSLIQRVLYPDQFCPQCNDRLFLDGNKYRCINCNFSRLANVRPSYASTPTPTTTNRPTPSGKANEVVEKVIAEAENNMRDAPRTATPNAKGEQIRKLAEKMGDSTVPPTKADEEILKGSDPNVRDINWVG